MPQMRVTEGSITSRVMANLQRNVARSGRIQEQLSSGKQISRPSDSPTGTLSSMQLRGEARVNEQYSRNADDGLGWLGTIDDTLTSSLSRLNRARELGIMSQSGINSSESREALAIEVENIRDSLIGLANTTYLGRPVFGGTTTGPAAYDSAGVYLGDGNQVLRTVGGNAQVPVAETGPNVFGTGPNQVFAVLTNMAANLRSNNTTALGANMDQLDVSSNLIKTTLSDVGARYNRVSQANDTAKDRLVSLKGQISDIEDIDLPKTIMDMQLQSTAYQSALAATAKVIQPSLLDYLR
ncbi:flagellar hook-associated protein FlgL [Krasilnikovia sp. M28-CT-15]|uniref:flagellar hook-associated protein FlgL n=1 Tax=Krasilnikovia sp. M28-CT-15 TaxID=3373540 RepID=UPI0038769B3C